MTDANPSPGEERRRQGAALAPARRLDVEVWFDFICPWCFIGKRQLESALRMVAASHPEVAFALRWHPHPLLPDTPLHGVSYLEFYRRRLGSEEAVARRQAQVLDAARRAGVTIAFKRIRVLPNTLAAHRLALQAGREAQEGGMQAGAMIEALFREYFLLGHDIGRPAVLQAVAARSGITGDAEASPLPMASPDVTGVPLFRFGGAVSVEGAQPPETLVGAMEQALRC